MIFLESFDADEFEAAMICSIETSSCMNEEETTTKDDGIIKALENAIVLFETFCLMDDFEDHAMDDEINISSTTPKPETINTMPFPANKGIAYPSHELAMKTTMVHIEYPDRAKLVSSMNHEQYEEMKT
jgi:CRISPR/Cas system CSM-associated protein Csm4 (group 5 of RAMP superfamily)